jgi:hypothetical protein
MLNSRRIASRWVCLVASSLMTSAAVAATTLTFQQFELPLLSGLSGWQFGAQGGGALSVVLDPLATLRGSAGSLRGTYPTATGGTYAWGVYNVASLNTREIYIDFWAKMPAAKQGLKFIKIFGGDARGYANTTFALDYAGSDKGAMAQVSFGDGSSGSNDTANVINFDGSNPEWIGRSFGRATVRTPQNTRWASSNWGTGWHHFKLYCKFNSGTTAQDEVADGAYYVEIDGKVYVDAKGIFNRHYSNEPIDRIELFGWAQSGSQPFELWYDDVRITTGGFTDSGPQPGAPTAVRAD